VHALEGKFLYLFSFIPLSPGIVLPFFTTFIIIMVCYIATRNMTAGIPGPLQNLIEVIHQGMRSFIVMIVGEENEKELLPILSTFFVYILCSNLMGIVPGLKSATGLFANCLNLSVIVFIMTAYLGLKNHGLGYIKHFLGPVWWLVPLMFPLHIVSEIARPVSLTLRLFGNIMGEDLIIMVLSVYLMPLLLPLPMYFLAVFTSILQAAVFTILSGAYFAGAISEAH